MHVDCYCIMVKTGDEEKFKASANEKFETELKTEDDRLYFFKKQMSSRQGRSFLEPLFPGYVFLETAELTRKKIEILKTVNGFYHFLFTNEEPQRLHDYDLEYFTLFKQSGELLGLSNVSFDENQRIVITSGPLKGFEGHIIRVNRRCHRVTILIEMLGNSKKVDLSYSEVAATEA